MKTLRTNGTIHRKNRLQVTQTRNGKVNFGKQIVSNKLLLQIWIGQPEFFSKTLLAKTGQEHCLTIETTISIYNAF